MSGQYDGVQRRIWNYVPHTVYINCRCHRLALCFEHLMDDFPWLKTVDSLLLGLWKTFHFSSKNHYTLKEIQLAYGMKALKVIKASVTRWLSHGAACKRCCKRYNVIVDALDDIISINPQLEVIGYRSQLLDSKTLLQILFLEDVLSITNTLSLVFEADKKDFGAIRRGMNSTITKLTEMANNQKTIHLKSFYGQNEVLMEMNTSTDCNIVTKGTRKRARIELTVEPKKFY